MIEENAARQIFNYSTIKKLDEENGSSFYLLNIDQLRTNFKKIEKAFKSRYENFIIGYSYKTNYVPYLCKELSKFGAYAEVVSRLEYDLALKIGQESNKIILNGPLKTSEDIEKALNNESIINLDSMYEIEFVREYSQQHPNKEIKVGLRVNFDLSENGESPLVEGHEISRFGICVENGDLQHVVEQLKAVSNIQIVGLHGHFSTSNRKVATFRRITEQLCQLAKEHFPTTIEYIDIGGGIFGEVPKSLIENAPTFDDYAEAVCKIMKREFDHYDYKPALILEPGISMVANCFTFTAKVIATKKINDQQFVLVDGSVHNIKPTLHKKNLPMKLVSKDHTKEKVKDTFQIVGYTCLEKDYLARDVQGQLPQPGDYFIFDNVGAYTIVLNPPFIKERPAIVAYDNDEIIVVRKKETISEFFNEDIYKF
nr:alanine racemase [Anaerobacillus isosaccharinicus]QOY38684.1 alanine racemase [Anaerobacillus isosaccharinicus]